MPIERRRSVAMSLSLMPSSFWPMMKTLPSSGFSSPAMMPSSVLLPEPDLPMMAVNCPAETVEIDALEDLDVAVVLLNALDPDDFLPRARAPDARRGLCEHCCIAHARLHHSARSSDHGCGRGKSENGKNGEQADRQAAGTGDAGGEP